MVCLPVCWASLSASRLVGGCAGDVLGEDPDSVTVEKLNDGLDAADAATVEAAGEASKSKLCESPNSCSWRC